MGIRNEVSERIGASSPHEGLEEKYNKYYKSYKIKKYYEDYADFVYDFENGDLNYKFEMEENNITNQKQRKKRDTLRHLFSPKFTIIGVGAVMVRPSIAKCSLHHNFLINFFYEIFLALYDKRGDKRRKGHNKRRDVGRSRDQTRRRF